jgi:hypothetical protein
MVEPMKPLTPTSSVSRERREAALEALLKDRPGIEAALEGIDAKQVLEMLSEDFLYPRTLAGLAGASASSTASLAGGRQKEAEQQQQQPPPPTVLSSYRRPSGRPELVPGAMTRASMQRYKEKRDLMRHAVQQSASRASGTIDRTGEGKQQQGSQTTRHNTEQPSLSERDLPTNERIRLEALKEELQTQLHVESAEVLERQKTKQQRDRLRGISSSSSGSSRTFKASDDDDEQASGLPGITSENINNNSDGPPKKSRKRVVKNLPKRREMPESSGLDANPWQPPENMALTDVGGRLNNDLNPPRFSRSGGGEFNNLELRKYYATPLLTPQEEYDLGQKIQMMIACEQVHEGLSIDLSRLPTIQEWAKACGYVKEDASDFVFDSLVEHQIRPTGCENMFEETDPNLFVGNGLAHMVGVGRGRGRARKPPPNKLKDVYDEREVGRPKSRRTPLNRGTTRDFCDMMMEGRKAKQRMVQSNMRLVVSISRKYSKVGINLQDMVQEGSLGLSRAAEKYDPTRGFKFSTYASWYVFEF